MSTVSDTEKQQQTNQSRDEELNALGTMEGMYVKTEDLVKSM